MFEDIVWLLDDILFYGVKEKWLFRISFVISSNPQPPSKNDIELKEKEATQKKRLKEVKIATRRHKIPLPHNAT